MTNLAAARNMLGNFLDFWILEKIDWEGAGSRKMVSDVISLRPLKFETDILKIPWLLESFVFVTLEKSKVMAFAGASSSSLASALKRK